MENDKLMLCDACSQLWTIRVETLTNENPIKFCPCCGSPMLRKVRSAVKEILSGMCFAGMDKQLVLLLYGLWRANTAGFPRFVDFVKDQIANG